MKIKRWLTVLCGGAMSAACLLVSPLDDVNDDVASGGSGATGGDDGSAGSSGASGSAGGTSCTTHVECSELFNEEPARCVKGVCRAIKTEQCSCVPNVPGEIWKDPNSILIGAFSPLENGTHGCGSDVVSLNYRLALEELNAQNIGGLPGPGASRRPIAVVLCNNSAALPPAEREQAVMTASQHLTEVLEVPAVLAYVDSGDLQKAFATYGQTNGVMFFTPGGATETLAAAPDDRLLWHMLGLLGDVAAAYAAAVLEIEQVAPTTLEKPGPIQVMLLTMNVAASIELRQEIEKVLIFNGMNVGDNGENYKVVTVDPTDPGAAALQITAEKPHIVISTIDEIFNPIHFDADTQWRPYYVLSPFQLNTLGPLASDIANTNGAVGELMNKLQERYVGVNVAGSEDTDLLQGYASRLTNRFGPNANTVAENVYDSVYYLAYAMLAGGTLEKVVGGDLPLGMDAILAQGSEFNVGPDHVSAVFQELVKPNGELRLNGTMGPPIYFNRNTGVRRNTGALYCLQRNVATGSITPEFHVAHYDDLANPPKLRKAKLWQGQPELPCLGWMNLPDN